MANQPTRWSFVKEMREEVAVSQAHIARRAHISQPYLSQIESGQIESPTIETVVSLAGAFSIPLHYLLRRAGFDCGCGAYSDGKGA